MHNEIVTGNVLPFNIFEKADSKLLAWIRDVSVVREITTSCRLIEEGSTPDGLFVVESGPITVCTKQADGGSLSLASLKAGNLVGEMSWLEERPAVASVDAGPGSRLLQIPRAALESINQSEDSICHLLYRVIAEKLALQVQGQNAWVHRIAATDQEPLRKVLVLFAELEEKDVAWIARSGKFKRLMAGDILLEEGDNVPGLYLLLSGEARISITKNGSWQSVGSSRRGELLGELTMLNPQAAGATANVDTLTGLELLVLDKQELSMTLNANPRLAKRFYKGIARMLSQRSRDQLLSRGFAEASRMAEEIIDNEQLGLDQLSAISSAGLRFDWLCRQFQDKEG
ncbi:MULTISPECIES: cyclic nucleotide-binding domain-containing protein [unclassified Prochlorococcus]|uniref:cyclic nucleotide-binding domain-containing protein n=1 Tax=unclassified Prochlorococcus TaxID=2627481 RepID=UPI000533725C|nr:MULTISPECIES: cyclic nucleotide-binding domain-containing protein [unclassified Prochlorococcus]KGG25285.1 cAMP-binding proteins - catabolite protein activator and regulatory subunit of cAMP-dependent protein kinase [Prochlorococcus sp. MIT 0701]KGG26317.1 cAMP-binding proteins - catabolite protein activator and regulatory subunit of cAMP-dependent protein kinase [Prochlorococcus sp. MIT 0702]KGG31268.1 cAMP-binding proteins - catabolite protein activator and regulatory subunit of cAMP-depend